MNKTLLSIMLIIANLIFISLCFAVAIIKGWWLCLFLPLLYNFRIKEKDEEKDEEGE